MSASFMEKIRSARKIEWIALAVAVALLALTILDGTQGSGGSTDIERRLEQVLSSVEGAGGVRTMVMQDKDGSILGVLIVAEGAGNVAVRLRLAQAAKALLNVDMNRIEVVKMSR